MSLLLASHIFLHHWCNFLSYFEQTTLAFHLLEKKIKPKRDETAEENDG